VDHPWRDSGGALIAAPLNDAGGNVKWWTPEVDRAELRFECAKESIVELAHLWTIHDPGDILGEVGPGGRKAIAAAVKLYYKTHAPP